MDGKNLCLITIDALRKGNLGCYGHTMNTSPTIDKLAKNGIMYTNAFTNNSATTESFSSMFTSHFPFIGLPSGKPINDFQPSFVERLHNQGVNCAGFHSNPYLMSYNGFNRGFSHFFDYSTTISKEGIPKKPDSLAKKIIKKNQFLKKTAKKVITQIDKRDLGYLEANLLNQEVFNWLDQVNDIFFLWIHYMDVHGPYIPSRESLEKLGFSSIPSEKKMWSINDRFNNTQDLSGMKDSDLDSLLMLYDGGIRYTDDAVKALMDKFKELDLLDSTAFIITADHGEEFLEHGNLGHSSNLYDELLGVPLILYNINGSQGKTVNTPVSHIDIAPTVSSWFNSSKSGFLGQDILQYRDKEDLDRIVYAEDMNTIKNIRIRALRNIGWKYILNEHDGTEELYNLTSDKTEKNNLADVDKNKLVELRKLMQNHITFEKKVSQDIEKARIQKTLSKKLF